MPKLLLKKKSEIIAEYIIAKSPILIGNGEGNDISIIDKSISANHCEIYFENAIFFVKDRKSAFGTLIDNERVVIKALLPGTVIGLGNSPYYLTFLPLSKEVAESKATAPDSFLLIGIQGKFIGKKFELVKGETRIGRDEDYNEIFLPGTIDPSVSRRHCTIQYDGHGYILSDKRSRNRTFINQIELAENDMIVIKPSDELLVGHTIFRFCPALQEDISYPKKAGIFLTRMRTPLLNFASLVGGLAGLAAFFLGVYGWIILTSIPVTPTITDTNWSPKILKDSPANTLPAQYDISPSPAIGNILGNGLNSIVFAFPYGKVYAWDGKLGEVVWDKPYDLCAPVNTSPTLFDMNQDGAQDIIICADDSRVYVIDGTNGKLIYKSPIIGGRLSGSPAIGDLDRNGLNDIVVCSLDGFVQFIYNPVGSQSEIKSSKVAGEILSPPILYEDISETIAVIATIDGKLYFFNGSTLESKSVDTAEAINKAIGSHLPINEIASCSAIGDVDDDNSPEIISFSKQYYVTCVDMASRNLDWMYFIEPPSIKVPPLHFSSPLLADITGDNVPDIIITAPNGKVIALRGNDQTNERRVIWEYLAGEWNRIIASPACADLDKDGIPDIVFAGEDGSITALRGAESISADTDRVLFTRKGNSTPITSTPGIGDVDQDGYIDIVVSQTDGTIQLFNTNTRVFKNSLFFSMDNVDAAHNGLWKPQAKYPIIKMQAIGGPLLMLFLIISYVIRLRSMRIRQPAIIRLSKEPSNA